MGKRGGFRNFVGFALVLGSMSASGAVILTSATLTNGSGQSAVLQSGGFDSIPATFVTTAFPNNATNSATIDAAGALHVKTSVTGSTSASTTTPTYKSFISWTSRAFDVTFDVQEPSTYSFTYDLSPNFLKVHLTKGGVDQFVQTAFNTKTPASGTLLPGTYSLTGQAGSEQTSAEAGVGSVKVTPYILNNILFDVAPAPEPGSVAMITIALASAGLRRRRRGSHR